ncbi:MAG: amidohydrolase [Candidatus Izimaplasma sp.]|nr:amidohydrolase [Candidatus Izimaplasma bacterium]
MSLMQEAILLTPEIVKNRRYLHQNAEVHNELPITQKYVKEQLIAMGLEPIEVSKSSLVVNIKGPNPGKTFLLRADMDALPMKELVDLPFKSQTENMHACGHDLHTSMLLGAAKILKAHQSELVGTVKLMFQPAEETLSGAAEMIEGGVLENPQVDAAMMIHVFSGIPAPTGLIFYMAAGPASASSDWFDIQIQGKGGHGAMPNMAVDPLVTMSNIHLALGEINAREVDPDKFLVITPCVLKGGTVGNVIPDSAYMQGTIRTFDNDVRELAKKRVKEIAEGIALTYRCTADVKFSRGCPSLINDQEVRDSIVKYTKELIGPQAVLDASIIPGAGGGRMGGSEDFAFISELVPSTMLGLAANVVHKDGKSYGQHHPKVQFDEKALPVGAAVYANAAISWLKEHK